MPKFPKSDGYKMKGFEYPGKSPLKVSDSDLVAAQAELDTQETQFRQPGWARAAYKVHKSILNPFSSDDERDLEKKTNEALKHTPGYGGGVKAKSGGESEKTQSVGERMGNVGDLQSSNVDQGKVNKIVDDFFAKRGTETTSSMSSGDSKLKRGTIQGLNYQAP
tara:strand:- start:2182 stop:2673 length:492 start_codon:yes stop_codon:yes gene_type:complete